MNAELQVERPRCKGVRVVTSSGMRSVLHETFGGRQGQGSGGREAAKFREPPMLVLYVLPIDSAMCDVLVISIVCIDCAMCYV